MDSVIAEELDTLDGLIDYAEKMIYDRRDGSYTTLRRHAYGKTVKIETDNEGILTFRLSSTSLTYPNMKSGYATPYSPVGRLCSYLRTGDEGYSVRWGDYRVIETRLFERYDGVDFEPNVRNFLRMSGKRGSSGFEASNLRARLKQLDKPDIVAKPDLSGLSDEHQEHDEDALNDAEALQAPSPKVVIDIVDVIEEDDVYNEQDLEEDVDDEISDISNDKYYGLSEIFYVNRTRDQDKVISRSPIGPMFVQGIAGSGKTSVALGRTKMLCGFNTKTLVEDEKEYREIAGSDLEYWSRDFVGQFSQESSVGFVRTGELIQYLKETCRRLDLPNLPVLEYPELRARLRQHRQIERNRPETKRWSGLPAPRQSNADTTMAWLRAADKAIAALWIDEWQKNIPNARDILDRFDPAARGSMQHVATAATQRLREEIESLVRAVTNSKSNETFLLDRFASKLKSGIDRVRENVLGKNVLWILTPARGWFASTERGLAQRLITDKFPLYLRSQARLVFVTATGLTDDSLTLLNDNGDKLSWCTETSDLLERGSLLARDSDGRVFKAKKSDEDDLYLRLMPEATEKLYVLSDGRLRPLGVKRGLGKVKLPIASMPDKNEEQDEEEMDVDDFEGKTAASPQKRRSLDSVFEAMARSTLLQPLTYIADLYADALKHFQNNFPDATHARFVLEQMNNRKLADEDIDLLLCLTHIIGRGFHGKPHTLNEPEFYQSVFVDEVQDFSEQQIYLMVEQAHREYQAVTVVGDIAQKLHNGHQIDIMACFPGKAVPCIPLTENMRQIDTPALALFSACFRAELQDDLIGEIPGDALTASLREYAESLRGPELVTIYEDEDCTEHIIQAIRNSAPHFTLAVILPDAEMATQVYEKCKPFLIDEMIDAELSQKIDLARRHIRHFTSVANAKGLEFDVVIVPYLERYDISDPTHINRLYVALTRARRKLVLLDHASRMESAFDAVWNRYQDTLASV